MRTRVQTYAPGAPSQQVIDKKCITEILAPLLPPDMPSARRGSGNGFLVGNGLID